MCNLENAFKAETWKDSVFLGPLGFYGLFVVQTNVSSRYLSGILTDCSTGGRRPVNMAVRDWLRAFPLCVRAGESVYWLQPHPRVTCPKRSFPSKGGR